MTKTSKKFVSVDRVCYCFEAGAVCPTHDIPAAKLGTFPADPQKLQNLAAVVATDVIAPVLRVKPTPQAFNIFEELNHLANIIDTRDFTDNKAEQRAAQVKIYQAMQLQPA